MSMMERPCEVYVVSIRGICVGRALFGFRRELEAEESPRVRLAGSLASRVPLTLSAGVGLERGPTGRAGRSLVRGNVSVVFSTLA